VISAEFIRVPSVSALTVTSKLSPIFIEFGTLRDTFAARAELGDRR